MHFALCSDWSHENHIIFLSVYRFQAVKMPSMMNLIILVLMISTAMILVTGSRESARNAEIDYRNRLIYLLEKMANVSHRDLQLEHMRPYIFNT